MPFQLDHALRYVFDNEGSDLHLKVGAQPMARIHGALMPIPDSEALRPEDTEEALRILTEQLPASKEEFDAGGEADLPYAIPGVSRFRVSVFRQRGSISVVARVIPYQVRTIEDLGLPPVIRDLAEERRGIILLTGTTGSGKSTTLAAMIDHINERRQEHIITLEDPIEYLHSDKQSIINQREVGSDTSGFAQAMRRVLRQDPDVILIGEMRDEETVRTALSAAETGHLVLSTLHTLDATETINRIIDFFPPHLQQQARVMLASTLRGAVSQRLVPSADGQGRVAASEVMVVTGRVEDLILNPEETGKISQVIAEGEYYGMQTFDQSLLSHVQAGRVSEAVAMDYASSPHDFKLMLAASGKRASDISQVEMEEEAEADPPPVVAEEPPPVVEEPPPVVEEPPPIAPVEPVAAEPAEVPAEPPPLSPIDPVVGPEPAQPFEGPPFVPLEPGGPRPVEPVESPPFVTVESIGEPNEPPVAPVEPAPMSFVDTDSAPPAPAAPPPPEADSPPPAPEPPAETPTPHFTS